MFDLHVLIVGGEYLTRINLSRHLGEICVRVSNTGDCWRAAKYLVESNVDIVFTRPHLLGIVPSGFHFALSIRRDHPKITVIMLISSNEMSTFDREDRAAIPNLSRKGVVLIADPVSLSILRAIIVGHLKLPK